MPKHVMIVDDDVNNRDFLSTVLKKHGYDWSAAVDGREALEKLKEVTPNLLILDVMMPKKSGFAMFKEMQKNEEHKDIPVIMLTAISSVIEENKEAEEKDPMSEIGDAFHDKMEKMVDFYRSEGDVKPQKFLDKPIDPAKFIEAVEEIIGKP